jgi:hypothetical protein
LQNKQTQSTLQGLSWTPEQEKELEDEVANIRKSIVWFLIKQ